MVSSPERANFRLLLSLQRSLLVFAGGWISHGYSTRAENGD